MKLPLTTELDEIIELPTWARAEKIRAEVEGLLAQDNLIDARPMVLDLQRLDPQNAEVRKMLREVQKHLSRQQKTEHIELVVKQVAEAELARRYIEAQDLYKRAERIDRNDLRVT